MIRTRSCAYQGLRNISFSEDFYVRTKWMIPYEKRAIKTPPKEGGLSRKFYYDYGGRKTKVNL